MFSNLNNIFKFLFGFSLAVLVSGAVYYYLPNLPDTLHKTWFYMASLASTQNQAEFENYKISLPEVKESQPQKSLDQINLNDIKKNDENKEIIVAQYSAISEQDKIDELLDKIDTLKRQINDLILASAFANASADKQKLKEENLKLKEENNESDEQNQLAENNNPAQTLAGNYSGGSGVRNEYPKILISEVEIAGATDDKQEFVELYNPNSVDVDLTDWYLQRKTKFATEFSTYASSNLFVGKKIVAYGYFLIARSGVYINASVDIWVDNALTEDNSLVLKNPNREISDLLGWGGASDFEGNLAESPPNGLSIGRKWENNTEKETDNNFVDLEVQNLTPKAQNLKYIAPVDSPIIPPSENATKILISEILLGDDEFIELYNPNNSDVDLTNWYLQRKTAGAESYSSYVTKTDFENKKILANDYFLIVRQGSQYENLADIIFDQPLTEDNSLILKDFNGNISDKLGWGLATDFELLATVTPENGKSLSRKFVDNIEQDTDNNFNDFELKTPTPKAKNVEPEPATQPPAPPPPEKLDATGPSVNFNLSATQTELNFDINFEITDILETTSSGVASYIFKWTDADPLIEENWHQDDAVEIDGHPMSIQLIRNFIEGQDGKTYYFQIKAVDFAENSSSWLPIIPAQTKIEIPLPVAPLKPIVINEIQTEGKTVKDEFIELYNPNNFDVDLNGYALKKKTSSGAESNLVSSDKFSGIILANNYFLIAPQDNTDGPQNYTGLIAPDLRYSGISYSVASNNTVLLYDKSEILQDKVGFGAAKDFETAFAANPPASKSISRISGIDTDDNSKDFIILDSPTPKAE